MNTTRPSAEAIAQAFWEIRPASVVDAPHWRQQVIERARELDAGREAQEPVAEIVNDAPSPIISPVIRWHAHWRDIPIGTKLYTHPQAAEVGEEMVEVSALYAFLRDSKACSFQLSHNDHHNMYLSVADTLDDAQGYYDDIDEPTRAKMIETDTIWTLHIYPNTPVGFNVYHSATLDGVIKAALAAGRG